MGYSAGTSARREAVAPWSAARRVHSEIQPRGEDGEDVCLVHHGSGGW
jgi:hypothetical protein